MEQNTALRLMVVWPERAAGEYRQEPEEDKIKFLERVQGVAGMNHKRGSLQGRLVGFMTNDSWRQYCRAREASLLEKSIRGVYKHLPRPEFAMKAPATNLLRVDLTITGIASLGRCISFFEDRPSIREHYTNPYLRFGPMNVTHGMPI